MTINAVEAYPLDSFSPEVRCRLKLSTQTLADVGETCQQAIRSGLAEAQRVANGSGSEEEKMEAKAELGVSQPPFAIAML